MKTRLAVFDIDGTIFRSSLIIELLVELVESAVFPPEALKYVEKDYQAWVNREGGYEEYINKVVDSYYHHIKGKSVEVFEKVENNVINKHKGKVYRFTRNLTGELKDKGYYLLAISGSPEGIVQKFSKEMGFDGCIGTVYEYENGVFTGRKIRDAFLEGKHFALHEYIKTNALDVDLSDSIAVGDTHGDMTLLDAVGHPIAFNPTMTLASLAKEKGWRIVVERKDVIYEVRDFEVVV